MLLTADGIGSSVDVVIAPLRAMRRMPESAAAGDGTDTQSAEEEMTLAEASARSGLACGTLRVLIHRRRMTGRKRGRDWFVTQSSLDAYLSSRDSRGRRADNPKAHRR